MPSIGEIRMFAGDFAPAGWLVCDGQVVAIADYPALFNLIGTTYGGDGENTFALPDLRGRAPIHQGRLDNASFLIGESGGAEVVALTDAQMPIHTHPLAATPSSATKVSPEGAALAQGGMVDAPPFGTGDPRVSLAPAAIAASGGGQPHPNLQPFVVVNFIIAAEQSAQPPEPYLAEIRIYPYDFAPQGWVACNGQLVPIAENPALFSVIGTAFGGDGRDTFALPDLRAATPMGAGEGPGLSERIIGDSGGSATVVLDVAEGAAHSHTLVASLAPGSSISPAGGLPALTDGIAMYGPPESLVPMSPQVVGAQGGGQPHNNMQPFLVLTVCIAIDGIYPDRP